jgi:hypothetical protein
MRWDVFLRLYYGFQGGLANKQARFGQKPAAGTFFYAET